ncbi:MAG: hypothetical protein KAU89_09640 [Candidatus Thorarchaeota archaeon]|nr:hypothetical protein [Candidatus Thorarchaeota archaeon]
MYSNPRGLSAVILSPVVQNSFFYITIRERVTDAMYTKRDWTRNDTPTIEKDKALNLDWKPTILGISKKCRSTALTPRILPEMMKPRYRLSF